ncbi:MAG TPA: ABC transporter permease [Pseudonocardiaceae bacterium]|jgi:peptide/nickel transport system permease protein|nr:ABC transporter permease [Pseudonocardiaceae bacterium]
MTAAVSSAAQQGIRANRTGWLAAALRSRYVVAGLVIIGVFTLVAIVGPYLVGDPNTFGGTQLAAPSRQHWFGTTQIGQDVFTQLVDATRATLAIGALSAVIATVVSVGVGVGGGFAGGVADEALSLVSNVALVIPQLPLVILIAAYVRHTGIWSVVLVIALTSWAASARILRAQTLSLRGRDYVLAARAYGERPWRIVVVELIPNELPIIVSQFIYAAIAAILTQSTLSFLGLADPSQLTWGNILFFAQNDSALASGAWWWFVPPGLCIALVGTALSMLNFGLDEVLNPRLRGNR